MTKSPTDQLVSHLPDADMQAVPQALLRASQRAREIAEKTGTKLIVREATPEERAVETEKVGR